MSPSAQPGHPQRACNNDRTPPVPGTRAAVPVHGRCEGHAREVSPPAMGQDDRRPVYSPWNYKWGHCLQGWAQHQHLELAPSQKIPGCGLEDGGKRAGSEGRLTASSDTQPGDQREPGGCGSGAGALRSHSWGWRRKARVSRLSKDEIILKNGTMKNWGGKGKLFSNLGRKTSLKRKRWMRFDH